MIKIIIYYIIQKKQEKYPITHNKIKKVMLELSHIIKMNFLEEMFQRKKVEMIIIKFLVKMKKKVLLKLQVEIKV